MGDKPPVGATVHLIPRAGANSYLSTQQARTGPDGSFSFSAPPGSYRLIALPLMGGLQVFDPAVQAALRPFMRRLDLDAAESATVNLRLPRRNAR